MRPVLEHLLSVLAVTAVLGGLAVFVMVSEEARRTEREGSLQPYLEIGEVDLGDPLHAALMKEVLDQFYPQSERRNDSLLAAIQQVRLEHLSGQQFKSTDEAGGLSVANAGKLGGMYAEFILLYAIVMVLTYHATHTLAIIRFVRMKQRAKSFLPEFLDLFQRSGEDEKTRHLPGRILRLFGGGIARIVVYSVFFSPAYVVAYSIRSGIRTDSIVFLILLGTVTNGLLINYANKFYTFLVSESRKGYVQTAIVKNLADSYVWGEGGIPYRALFRPKRLLSSHVFHHIYLNARFQYLSSIKEHATFLITGLMIIEMALNIQGHLGYTLMQNILYNQYDVVFAIILGVFLVVKATEVLVDIWIRREAMHYENRQ